MNCREARELLFAFLDNELDAALSIEMQRHLERCPSCAREAEIERTIGKCLAVTLEQPSDAPALDEQQLAGLLTVQRRPVKATGRRRSRWWAFAACAMLLVSASVIVLWVRLDRGDFISRDVLVDEFNNFIVRGQPVQLASTDRLQVADWISHELHARVELPVMHGHCKLLGAGRCKLAGQAGAVISYDVEGQPASVLVLARGKLDVDGMTRADSVHWVDRCRGRTIIVSRPSDVTYVAVAELPLSQILDLVPAGGD